MYRLRILLQTIKTIIGLNPQNIILSFQYTLYYIPRQYLFLINGVVQLKVQPIKKLTPSQEPNHIKTIPILTN